MFLKYIYKYKYKYKGLRIGMGLLEKIRVGDLHYQISGLIMVQRIDLIGQKRKPRDRPYTEGNLSIVDTHCSLAGKREQ